jgi:hypothetical protein
MLPTQGWAYLPRINRVFSAFVPVTVSALVVIRLVSSRIVACRERSVVGEKSHSIVSENRLAMREVAV